MGLNDDNCVFMKGFCIGVLSFELDIIYIPEYYREQLYIKKMGDSDAETVVIMHIVV